MAVVLNDQELRKLLGKVIIDGDEGCVRPNSYVLRLGPTGEFLNAGKEFALGKKKRGIRIAPGHSVAVTALETLDFGRETVHSIYPGHDLHALVSPTTDLSREAIVAPTTQVDAGYHGTLNWTITNTSNDERRFLLGERIYRLTIFRLEEGETPDRIYDGDYQGQTGYVRSTRKGAPAGMREDEWESSLVEGGPEQLLDNLLKSGYPWHALGHRLKSIDGQFRAVSDEYAEIRDSLDKLATDVDSIRRDSDNVEDRVRGVVKETISDHASALQNRWLVGTGGLLVVLLGLVLSATSNAKAFQFLKDQGAWIGCVLIILGIIALIVVSAARKVGRRRKPPGQ